MAYVDSITGLDRKKRRHFKKVFSQLPDSFLVRAPVLDDLKVAPCIIEGPCNSWLFIGAHLSIPTVQDIPVVIKFNQKMLELGLPTIKYLAVVEELGCDASDLPSYIKLVDEKIFYTEGKYLIQDNLAELSATIFARVKKKLFPESVVPAQCSTRRQDEIVDNSARLLPFFLDYDQELATRLDLLESIDQTEEKQEELSVRLINGVAGSGKTLILINRAIIYCRKYPNKKVLLVIHNRPVVEDIKLRFKLWLGGVPVNLEINTFHSFAWWQYKKSFRYVSGLFNEAKIEAAKKLILNANNEGYESLNLKDEQIWSELEYISDYMIKDKDEYLSYDRQGRGFALQKSQRESIWQLYDVMVAKLSDPQGYLPSLYIKDAALSSKPLPSYDHIMIDEAQFFAPSWLEVIKRSLTPGGGIFMCADPNQGFLKSRLSWKSVGLNVRGRTKRLTHSYRTTYEILIAANALLEGLEANTEDYVTPDYDKMERGNKPQVVFSRSLQDELHRFLNELEGLVKSHTIPLDQIMVLCSRQYNPWQLKKDIEKRVGAGSVVNYNDKKDLDSSKGSKIKLLNINSCTGMESSTTFVLGAGYIINQTLNIEHTESEREEARQEAMRKLYVAMTRAGQKLVVFSTETFPDTVIPYVEVSGST
ncbi:UvrD-helicase domain-containing protein [Photobacterium kasasachensis]|uniref:UvrD-helicase domain-containing protein n=1 Tax=Photobacterium kasasachensis TaxID=2910240 RepID=UPI003D0E63EE